MEEAEQALTFTSHMASNLKEVFDEKFNQYKQTLSRIDTVKPEKITSKLETTVNDYFNLVLNQIN